MRSVTWGVAVVVASFLSALPAGAVPLEEARIFIEFNDTDQDVGAHIFLDGDWVSIKVTNPAGRVIFEVEGRDAMGVIGLSELFVEGDEPSLDELPLDEFFDLFPAGTYTFEGRNGDGEKVKSKATFSHNIPDAPEIVSPVEGVPQDRLATVIDWEPVTGPGGVHVVGYEVIVEGEGGDMSVHVPGWLTHFRVPPEILRPGREYDYEVIAIDASGNQTITETSFETAD